MSPRGATPARANRRLLPGAALSVAALLGAALAASLAMACAPDGRTAGGTPGDATDHSPAGAAIHRPAITADQRSFLDHYAAYCGATYEGRSVLVNLGEDHPLDGARLRMTLESCDADEVRIPFQVDDDRSRTWILTRDDRGLRLAHDHRYEDGTEHAANFYGGYADDTGSATRQRFPADDRTIADRPAREINVWEKEFDLENAKYYYRLYLRGELRYEAEFDLGSGGA
jgi:hypothetical protein